MKISHLKFTWNYLRFFCTKLSLRANTYESLTQSFLVFLPNFFLSSSLRYGCFLVPNSKLVLGTRACPKDYLSSPFSTKHKVKLHMKQSTQPELPNEPSTHCDWILPILLACLCFLPIGRALDAAVDGGAFVKGDSLSDGTLVIPEASGTSKAIKWSTADLDPCLLYTSPSPRD